MSDRHIPPADPAAIYGMAAAIDAAGRELDYTHQLSSCYKGFDEFLRQAMRVATLFETWACKHVDFDALGEVWPYYIPNYIVDGLREADLSPLDLCKIIDDTHCRAIAEKLKLPLHAGT